MESRRLGRAPEIIYFESSDQKSHATLKRFLTYLKVNKVPGPIRFAFIDEKGPLIPTLSLRDNISLESIPSTVSSDKEFTLEDYLDRRGNRALTKLYNNIKLVEDLPSDVDSQTLKIASLIKGLLQDGQYLFLENPERFLDKENLQLFIDALLFQLQEREQTLLLKSSTPSVWDPYITQWIKESTCPTTGKIHLKEQTPPAPTEEKADNILDLPSKRSEEVAAEKAKERDTDPKAA